MSIKGYVYSCCLDNNKPSRRSGCAVSLIHTDELLRSQRINFGYPLGDMTQNVSELTAIKLMLRSVKKALKNQKIEITTNSTFLRRILERRDNGDYKMSPQKSQEIIKEIRSICAEEYEALSFQYVKVSDINNLGEISQSCYNMAKQAADDQTKYAGKLYRVSEKPEDEEASG